MPEEDKKSVTEKPQPKRKPREAASRPVFKQKLIVQSLQGQRIMNKSFEYVSRSLFRLGVILRIIGEQEEIDQVNGVIQKYRDEVVADFEGQQERLATLLSQNGVSEDSLCEFTSPKEYSIEISSPQLSKFVSLLSDLDKIIQMTDTLWLMGIFEDKQRMVSNYQAQQRLFRFAGRIIGLERMARHAAYNKGKEQEVEQEAPKSEQDQAEKELNKEESEAVGDKKENIKEALNEALAVPEKAIA